MEIGEKTMETLLIWLLIFGGWYWAFLKVGKRAVTRQLSKQEEADPWADFKRLASEVRTRKAKELAEWEADFKAIIRRTCTHDFQDEDLQREKWWVCVVCDYEKPWAYEEGCNCITTEDWALTDMKPRKVLYHRNGNCPVHGKPRLIAYHKNKR
jgi:hypothetical protein